MLRVLFVVLAVLLVVPGWTGEARLPLLQANARIEAQRVTLDPDDPARTRAGALTYMGGVALTSPDPAFGGFSSLTVTRDVFTMLSDGGNVARFRMGDDWIPHPLLTGYVPDGPGRGWEKRDRDSESMATDGSHIWVGFEGANAIWRYDAAFRHVQGWVKPAAMAHWPANGGAETMVRTADGRFVVISEMRHVSALHWVGSDAARLKTREGLIFARDPLLGSTPHRFAYVPPGRFDPSDAAELPNGDLIVLNRRFRLPYRFVTMITRVRAHDVTPGRIARPESLALLDAPLLHDNFEGVAVTREEGATMLWIVSDDNESILQRTLLLKFRLDR